MSMKKLIRYPFPDPKKKKTLLLLAHQSFGLKISIKGNETILLKVFGTSSMIGLLLSTAGNEQLSQRFEWLVKRSNSFKSNLYSYGFLI